MRVNWWPWYGNGDVVINNNIGGGRNSSFLDCGGGIFGCGCGGGYRGNSWFEKMMMFSMANNMLQQMINNISGKNNQTAQYVPPYACTYAPTNYPGLYLQQQQTKPEGAGGTNLTQDDQKLKSILSGYYKKIETLSDGSVLAVDKSGNIIKADSMDELLEKYQALAAKAEEEKAAQEAKEAKEGKDEVDTSGRVDNEGKVDGTEEVGDTGDAGDEGKIQKHQTGHKVHVPEGWYRAAKDGQFGAKLKETFVDTRDRKLKRHAATHFAEQLIRQKYNQDGTLIKDFDIKRLADDLAKYNPSIFDEKGNYKQGINIDEALNKLDIPNLETILKNYKK